jgi:vitamin B12 transporter
MRNGWCAAIAALVLTALPLAGGAVQAAEDGVYHLGEVVVSGQETGVEAIGTTHRVTAEEIEKRGVRSLDEALNLLPGVQVRVGGDGTPRIDMRGFRTRHIKLLLNGTPFNGTYDGQFDPALISVENISEIVVTTGAASTLYGSGGNAGVINIITKKAREGAHGSLGGELASWDTNLLRGTASYGAGRYDVLVSGSIYERDHFEVSDHFSPADYEDGDERENSDRRRNNLFANVGVSPTENTLIGVTVGYLTGERGKPASVTLDDYTSKKLKFEREDDVEEFNAQLALSHDFAGPFSIKGWAYFNSLDMLENAYDDNNYDSQVLKNSGETDSTTEISGVNLQARYDSGRFGALTLGGMFENNDWEADGYVLSKNNVLDNPDDRFDEEADFQLYSASIEYEVSPVRNLGAVVGVGYHWQDRDEKDEEDYSYLVGLHYDLFEGTRLKASHARKVRFPTLRDLYSTGDGNPDLGEEVTWHYEAGIEQALPAKSTLSVTGFYTDVEDFIAKDDVTEIRQNFEEYEFKGVEVLVENRYFDRLLVRAGYTYLDTEDKSSGSLIDEVQNNPKHKATLEATYRLPWNMSVYGSAMWVANAYTYNSDNTEQKRLPEYLLCDFRISKKAAGGALDLYFGVNNLFDTDYVQSYALPQPGRSIYGGVTWNF